jgi:hypothetical protein
MCLKSVAVLSAFPANRVSIPYYGLNAAQLTKRTAF